MMDLSVSDIGDYSFFRLPKFLFKEAEYEQVSTDAKLLFALLLDRFCLPDKNKWHDRNGRIYLLYSIASAGQALHFGHDKISRLFAELEKAKLIEREKQGQGRASRIYLLSFPQAYRMSDFLKAENTLSALPNNSVLACVNPDTNEIKRNKTDFSKNNLSISGYDATDTEWRIKEQIEYDILYRHCDKELLNGIVTLMVDTICANSDAIHIGENVYSRETVRSRLFSLNSGHIEYMLDRLKENTTKVRNPRAYMLSALFNAPTSIDYYYTAEVSHDWYVT